MNALHEALLNDCLLHQCGIDILKRFILVIIITDSAN